jgi:hypothetical protein
MPDKIENFMPMTDQGYFDAELDRRSKELVITVKMILDDGITANARAPKGNKTKGQAFKDKIRVIPEKWQGQYVFKLGSEVIVPKFRVEFVENFNDAHYAVTLLDATRDHRLEDAYTESLSVSVLLAVRNAKVFGDGQVVNRSGEREDTKRPRHTVLAWNSGYTPGLESGALTNVLFDFVEGYTLPYSSQAGSCFISWAQAFLVQTKQLCDRGLYVHFYLSNEGTPGAEARIRALIRQTGFPARKCLIFSDDRVKRGCLMMCMRDGNEPQRVVRGLRDAMESAKGKLRGKQAFTRERKDWEASRSIFKGFWKPKQFDEKMYHRRIINHEFGHMLGLPDDYINLAPRNAPMYQQFLAVSDTLRLMPVLSETLSNTPFHCDTNPWQEGLQKNYIYLCKRVKTELPVLGRNSVSIMAWGGYIAKSHFVTIWEVLKCLTGKVYQIVRP